jgi:hypothetical protein
MLDTLPNTPTTPAERRAEIQRQLDDFSVAQRVAQKLTGEDMVYCIGSDTPKRYNDNRYSDWCSLEDSRDQILNGESVIHRAEWQFKFDLCVPDLAMDSYEIDMLVESAFVQFL